MILTKIRRIREEKKLTQEDMAEKLCISLNAYSNFERGQNKNISLVRIKKIAEILEISSDELDELIKLLTSTEIPQEQYKNHYKPKTFPEFTPAVYSVSTSTDSNKSSELKAKLELFIEHKQKEIDFMVESKNKEIHLIRDIINNLNI